MSSLSGMLGNLTRALGIAMSAFHMYTAAFGLLPELQQRAIHFLFAALILYFSLPERGRSARPVDVASRCVLGLVSLGVFGYLALHHLDLEMRVADYRPYEFWISVVGILIVLDICRRVTGMALPILAVISILYGRFGPYMPAAIAHKGYSIERLLDYLFLTTGGIWGTAIQVSSTFVFLFIVLGAFLEASGAGKFFIDISNAVMGRVRGGPALMAVVSSALFGTISGSPAANVVGTGTFTIPLMKSIGYPPEFAGGVEAAASTGGAIMPPVMGAVAFLVAENLGISYAKVCVAAAIPAVLYYAGCLTSVYIMALKLKLTGLPPERIPDARVVVRKGWHLLAGPVSLVVFLAMGQSATRAGLFSTLILLAAAMCKKDTRLSVGGILDALESAARASLVVAATTACVGVVTGTIMLTGLGMKLSNVLLALGGGNVWVLLVLTMIASLILGMGLPSVACYIILAVIVAPGLVKSGMFTPIGIHLFLLYYGVLSFITPPVAVAAYVAAGLANTDPTRTGFEACKIAVSGLIIPFMFVQNPVLLCQGPALRVAWSSLTALVGVVALSAAAQGYLVRPLGWLERILFAAGALLLIDPGLTTDLIGLVIVAGLLVVQRRLAAGHRSA